MILLIDNYDSFTWNLYHLIAALNYPVRVVRNDAWSVDEVLAQSPEAVVLGAGPGRPSGAGICFELIDRLPLGCPVLGVCLGFQALLERAGGVLERDPAPVHGRASPIHHDGQGSFSGLANPFLAGRYHSLRIEPSALSGDYALRAWTAEGILMAAEHRSLPRLGVQFHPESILTPEGPALVGAFLGRWLAAPRTGTPDGRAHGR
jgi:anthranilate synthase component 2